MSKCSSHTISLPWLAGLVLVTIIWVLPVQAEEVNLTLPQLINTIEENNPALNALYTQVVSSKMNLDEARSKGGLSVKLELSPSYGSGEPVSFFAVNDINDPAQPNVFAEGEYLVGSIDVSYPLYKYGELFGNDMSSQWAAESKVELSEASLDLKKVYISNVLAKAYIDALQAKDKLEIYRKIVDQRSRQLEILEQKKNSRTVTESDLLALKSTVAKGQEGYLRSKIEYESAVREIADVAGYSLDTTINIVPIADRIPQTGDTDSLVKYALANRGELGIQLAKLHIAQSDISKYEADYYPEVDVSVVSSVAAGGINDETKEFSAISLNASYEFGFLSYTSKNVSAARSAMNFEQQNMEIMRSEVRRDVINATETLKSSDEGLKVAKIELERMEYEYRVASEKQKSGFLSVEDVIEKEDDLLSAQLSLVESSYDRWRSYADLKKSAGQSFIDPQPESGK